MEIIFTDPKVAEFGFAPATAMSAGYDLRAAINEPIYVIPGATCKINTGIRLHMGTDSANDRMRLYATTYDSHGEAFYSHMKVSPCAVIMPRSGLGCKGIKPRNAPGLIDADYQGEIIVCLHNESNETITIQPYDRIAQLVFMYALHPQLNVVTEFSNETARGANGFGSTGEQ